MTDSLVRFDPGDTACHTIDLYGRALDRSLVHLKADPNPQACPVAYFQQKIRRTVGGRYRETRPDGNYHPCFIAHVHALQGAIKSPKRLLK